MIPYSAYGVLGFTSLGQRIHAFSLSSVELQHYNLMLQAHFGRDTPASAAGGVTRDTPLLAITESCTPLLSNLTRFATTTPSSPFSTSQKPARVLLRGEPLLCCPTSSTPLADF